MIGLIRLVPLLLFAVLLSLATSCEHRILLDRNNGHYIRVYLDEEIKNITCGIYNESYDRPSYTRPMILRAVLADPSSGEVRSETLLRNHGSDERGSYIDGHIGARDGEYCLLIYQMGSPVTLIKNPNNFYEMTAYTKPVTQHILSYLPKVSEELGSERIMVQPEHLFADVCERVKIPASMKVDTLRNEEGDYFTARTIAKSYYLQLKIKGVEWVRAAAATLSGVSGSKQLCYEDAMVESDPVNLFFSMNYADKRRDIGDEVSSAVLYTTFNTFGKIPGITSLLTLNFEFTRTDGTTQVETIDITEVFKTPIVIEKQWILLEKEIVISPPDGTGGLDPGVEGWKDIESSVTM